jgi:hypothetical protein
LHGFPLRQSICGDGADMERLDATSRFWKSKGPSRDGPRHITTLDCVRLRLLALPPAASGDAREAEAEQGQ